MNFLIFCNLQEWCLDCFTGFKTEKLLQSHKFFCQNPESQLEILPEEGESLFFKFKSHNKRFKTPIIGYWDFETIQVPSEDDPYEKIHKPVQYSLIFTDATGKLIFEEKKFSEEGTNVICLLFLFN